MSTVALAREYDVVARSGLLRKGNAMNDNQNEGPKPAESSSPSPEKPAAARPKSLPAAHPTSDVPGGVWMATTELTGAMCGYLVADAHNVHRPIAFVIEGETSEDELAVAWQIAEDPESALWRHCVDLRQYGHPDSREPMPGGIYGLICTPVDEDKQVVGENVRCEPFCRFSALRRPEHAPNSPADRKISPASNGGAPPAATPAPQPKATAPTDPSGPWWADAARYDLTAEPVMSPKTADLIAYAVCVRPTDRPEELAGVIAVLHPKTEVAPGSREGGMFNARWSAKQIAGDPSLLDDWQVTPARSTAPAFDYRDRPPFVSRPETHERTYAEEDHTDLWSETRRLADHVWACRPPTDPLSILFEFALRSEMDDELSTDAELHHARSAFFELPEAEQRALLGGWHLDEWFYLTRDLRSLIEYAAEPVLMFNAKADDPKDVQVNADWALTTISSETHLLQVQVMVGTKREDVLACLATITEKINRNWASLIQTRPYR